MKSRSLLTAAAAFAASVVVFFLFAMALPVDGAVVEHTFVVSQMNMTHLCKDTLVTVVNGQLPGPTIEVTEGDTVTIHVINQSPNDVTIHWHGVKQWRNCWADGVPMITQPPIRPGGNFSYRFVVTGQEGTLWWHAHVSFLRATLHGALIIRPRHGADSYPFPKPHREIPIIIGEWWELDLALVGRDFVNGSVDFFSSGSTINGKLGDLFNCSGTVENGYVLEVEPGMSYLLRVINAALFSEYYLKIAGHKFTVVAADANYVSPYTTDVIAIAPGETVDALLFADAPPGRYYMVARPNQAPLPDTQTPEYTTRGIVQYRRNPSSHGNHKVAMLTRSSHEDAGDEEEGSPSEDDVPAAAPKMPDQHDTITSFHFHGNLTALHRPSVPLQVDEHLFVVLGLGSICMGGKHFCRRGENASEAILLATMNNVSFELPVTKTTPPLLEAHYHHHTDNLYTLQELPNKPPRVFDFTNEALIPFGPKEMKLEATSNATVVRRFKHNTTVEVVFQSTALLQGDSNPMHLHGHDMFVLAQGLGNFDPARDVPKYNLVNPPVKNTALVPNRGWLALRFVANNPGVWFMHCHYEFHLSMGMAAVFIVEDGPTVETSLPPPPADFSTCGHDYSTVLDELY